MNWFEHYANAGMSVLPIRLDGSKSPAVSSWAKYQLGAAGEQEIAQWHAEGLGVAIIGGRVSGGLEVIDIDDPSLAAPFYQALHEADPALRHKVAFVATPRRDPETGKTGAHVYFRSDSPTGNQKLAMSEPIPQFDADGEQIINPVTGEPVSKPETLIETRGEGGYVLTVGCPESCHPSGNTYEHRAGCEIAELEKLTDKERGTLLKVASGFDRSVALHHEHNSNESGEGTPGNQFAAKTSWEEILEPFGWTKAGANGKTQRWTRPGKSKGWSATTGLVSQNGAELFCVFSSNAHPFEGPTTGGQCSTHSKFDAYTRLNFAGDYKEAARHLAGEGFGSTENRKAEQQKPVVFETWDRITRNYLVKVSEGSDTTIDTGLPSLTDAVGGLSFGELVIIGGRPSHGKTLLALQLADHFSQLGHSPLLLSEEMSHPMLSKRRLHMATGIPEEGWHGAIDQVADDYREFAKQRSPVYIAPQCGTIARAIEVIDRAASEHDLRIVVVDYAQLLRGKGSSRYEQVTDVSQQLREATSRHNLLTLMLCQLNRGGERADSRPRSVDLRDSGQLEQDADVVMLVDWPKRRGSSGNHDIYDYFVYIEKNRNREIKANDVRLQINPRRQRIEEPDATWKPVGGGYQDYV